MEEEAPSDGLNVNRHKCEILTLSPHWEIGIHTGKFWSLSSHGGRLRIQGQRGHPTASVICQQDGATKAARGVSRVSEKVWTCRCYVREALGMPAVLNEVTRFWPVPDVQLCSASAQATYS